MNQKLILVKRSLDSPIDTTESCRLANTADYEVIETITQTRPEDSKYNVGSGTIEKVSELVEQHNADTVMFANKLTPTQASNIAEVCPAETEVIDRFNVVLSIFADRAQTKIAQLQVKLAKLHYRIPRVREQLRRDATTETRVFDEDGKQIDDLRNQIDSTEQKLNEALKHERHRREKRREHTNHEVAIVGYTNAGKSTLLRRLADDLTVSNSSISDDFDEEVPIDDRLFETLETTTRRATINGRVLMITDTVGFLDELPHDIVKAFTTTLELARNADLVILVIDASDQSDNMIQKLQTSINAVTNLDNLLITLNKQDMVDSDRLVSKQRLLRDREFDSVAISALHDDNIDELRQRILDRLPDLKQTEFRLPNSTEGMSVLSWLYNHGQVRKKEFTRSGDVVVVQFAAQPETVERAKSKLDSISTQPE